MEGYTVQLTIRKDGDKLVVLLVPKLDVSKDEIQREIVPLTVTGTPDELDQLFFQSIAGALKQAGGLQVNLTEFEAGLKKAAAKASGKDAKVVAPAKDTKPKEATKAIDFDAKPDVDKETGEIKEKPKGNSVKPSKTKKPNPPAEPETIEEPILEAAQPHPSEKDDFGEDDW